METATDEDKKETKIERVARQKRLHVLASICEESCLGVFRRYIDAVGTPAIEDRFYLTPNLLRRLPFFCNYIHQTHRHIEHRHIERKQQSIQGFFFSLKVFHSRHYQHHQLSPKSKTKARKQNPSAETLLNLSHLNLTQPPPSQRS